MTTTATSPRLLRTNRALTPRRRIAGALALAAIALGASACGSSSSSPTTSSAASSSTTSSSSASSSTTSTSSTSSATNIAAIEAKLAAGETATYLATYTLTGPNTSGTFTLAHDGTSSLVGFASKTGNFEETTSAGKSYICDKQSTAAAWTCYGGAEVATLGASLTDIAAIYGSKAALESLAAASGATQSSSTFAGQPVTCWTYHSKTSSGAYTVCVTGAGVIAEWKAQDSTGQSQMVLTSYSTSVPSSEFTPPATPTTMP